MLFTISGNSLSQLDSRSALTQLENGAVVFLPELSFSLTAAEQILYTENLLSGENKNISYNPATAQLSGIQTHQALTQAMMVRYGEFAKALILHLFPHYHHTVQMARTSFRPAEAAGRKAASYRKDDTRLHVDAFPATPNQGQRLLRVFSNVNPHSQPRVWNIGESFPGLVDQFADRLHIPFAAKKHLLKLIKVTKTLRSDYDELMLQLHDKMKADSDYQKNAQQQRVEFSAGSSWIVFSDQVSHAALAGQFCLEQTFLLPVQGMQDPHTSPLKILEKYFARLLV